MSALTHAELVDRIGVVIEGACDYVMGRPLSGNPYAPEFQPAYSAWVCGWREAEFLFPRDRLLREFARTWGRWPEDERWVP